MTKKTYKIIGLNCPSCAMLIESDLEDAGIKACCSYAKSELIIEFDEEKIDEEKVKKLVLLGGYQLRE